MLNAAHVLEVALLLLAAFLVAVAGSATRAVALRLHRSPAAPARIEVATRVRRTVPDEPAATLAYVPSVEVALPQVTAEAPAADVTELQHTEQPVEQEATASQQPPAPPVVEPSPSPDAQEAAQEPRDARARRRAGASAGYYFHPPQPLTPHRPGLVLRPTTTSPLPCARSRVTGHLGDVPPGRSRRQQPPRTVGPRQSLHRQRRSRPPPEPPRRWSPKLPSSPLPSPVVLPAFRSTPGAQGQPQPCHRHPADHRDLAEFAGHLSLRSGRRLERRECRLDGAAPGHRRTC